MLLMLLMLLLLSLLLSLLPLAVRGLLLLHALALAEERG